MARISIELCGKALEIVFGTVAEIDNDGGDFTFGFGAPLEDDTPLCQCGKDCKRRR